MPVAMVMIQDLLGDAPALAAFDGTRTQVHGFPAISTSMGGGIAVLAEGRFRIEVVSLGPEVPDKLRSQWLEGFRWELLKGFVK